MKATIPLGILLVTLFFLAALSAPVCAQSNQSGGGPFGADSTYCETVLK